MHSEATDPQRKPYPLPLQSVFTHRENKNSYVRLLLVDFSSAFSTISPINLTAKLNMLGLSITLCKLGLVCEQVHYQTVWLGGHTFFMLALNVTPEPPKVVCSVPPIHTAHLFTVYCKVCRRHHRKWPYYKQLREFILVGNRQSCRVVHREQSTAQRQQKQSADRWF